MLEDVSLESVSQQCKTVTKEECEDGSTLPENLTALDYEQGQSRCWLHFFGTLPDFDF